MKFECCGLNQGEKLKQNLNKAGQQVQQAAQQACAKAADTITQRGRADIKGAGRFGSRWTDAFNSVSSQGRNSVTITTTMGGPPPVAYWKVFEYGADISAKNPSGLLWIPVDENNRLWPRDYPGYPNSLFRIGAGLFDVHTNEPVYWGTPDVHIDQKFHLRDIVRQVAGELRQYYAASFKGNVK